MPLGISMGVKKSKMYYFNLNNYRNWHYQVSNELKKRYKDIASNKLEEHDISFENVELTFIMYRKDKRKIDRANVLSVHEKFFCDSLVELGYITDDNDNHITSSHYYTGGVDKDNPRVDITIQEV